MRTNLIFAALAAATLSTAAGAQTASFGGGLSTPSTGFTVQDQFNDLTGLSNVTGTVITQSGSNSSGAQPAYATFGSSSYLSVLGGASATYSLASLLPSAIQFDWGSLDSYNTLTVTTTGGGSFVYVPGAQNFPGSEGSNGNQVLTNTNGRFTFAAASGQRITGLNFASSQNSFEVDNLAVSGAVPEPATWAMMIGGFGAVGFAMRRRKARTGFAFA